MTAWQAGVSAPRDGRVIIGAWATLMTEGRASRRAWRYRFICWESAFDDYDDGFWSVCPAIIGAAWKRDPGPKSGRMHHVPAYRRAEPECIPAPEVWRDVGGPPDEA